MKYNSIGIFIKSLLYQPEATSNRRYPLKSGYEMWETYNIQQKIYGRKGLRYDSFLKYLYVLKRLQLIDEVKKTRKSRKPKPGEHHKSGFIPEEWEKNFYKAIKDNIDSEKWLNPYYYYKIITGKIYFERGIPIEKLPELTEAEINRKRQEALFKELAVPEKYVTVKISFKLKQYIDRHRGNKTISRYLTEEVFGNI